MHFSLTWDFIDSSSQGQKDSLALFSKWTPGPAKFHAFYGYADGSGGVAIIEAADAAELAKTLAPWTPWLRFSCRAILPIQESASINTEALAWRQAS
jgi:hypothetical protein